MQSDAELQLNNPTPSTDTVVFDLSLDDTELLTLIHKPLSDSEDYWENTFGLKAVRTSNVNLWLPNHWKNKEVYDYQEEYLYQDPRIFVSVETICATVNARIPQPEVMPAQDNVISQQMASDLQKVLFSHSQRYRINDIFATATRSAMLKRVGYVKLRFDKAIGDNGDIVPEHVLPEDMVVDQDARWGDTPRFYGQRLRNMTAQDLLVLFQDDPSRVYDLMGVNGPSTNGQTAKPTPEQLGKKYNIWEVWFRYYDTKEQKYGGGLAWIDDKYQHVLGKMRNPNWNYEEDYANGECSNFLDNPAPPFFHLNFFNDGSSFIDSTSLVEQAAPLQRILDRRGFQIMESAEMAGSGIVFNTQMIKKEDIARLSGAPDERVGVKGDVRAAFTRIAPPQLASYVIEDKLDARSEIADIFATHDITRGQQSAAKTLGQDMMQQNQDFSRMDTIARGVERMATAYDRYLVQMMKVYYKEEHYFKAVGEDGQFDFIMMRHDRIEDGTDVGVEASSTLPINKTTQMKFVTDLVPSGLVDPLTLYEVGAGQPMPSPKKMLERLLQFRTDPMNFMGKIQDEDFDREAFMDIQQLNAGQMPKTRDEISAEYIQFFNNYMVGGTYLTQTSDKIKELFTAWLGQCRAQAQIQVQAMMTQAPTQDDLDAAAQQQAKQTTMQTAMQGPPQPGQPAPGGPMPPAGGAMPPSANMPAQEVAPTPTSAMPQG